MTAPAPRHAVPHVEVTPASPHPGTPANLAARLSLQAEAQPEATALIWGKGARRGAKTFAQLDREAGAWAGRLAADGLTPGAAALVLQPMAPALYTALIAVMRTGATVVFPDPQALRATLRQAVSTFAPRAVLGPLAAHALRLADKGLRGVPNAYATGPVPPGLARRLTQEHPPATNAPLGPDARALATFTSGSTSAPKALARSHGVLGAQLDLVAHGLGLTPGQRWLSSLPVFPLAIIAGGATAVLPAVDVRTPDAIDAGGLLKQIHDEGVTGLILSPAAGACLTRACAHADPRLAGVKDVFLGGGPVFPDLALDWRRAAPHARLHAAYGSSEAEPIAHLVIDDVDAYAAHACAGGGLLAGRPMDGVRVRILSADPSARFTAMSWEAFKGLWAKPGEAGEIVVAGPHVAPGYVDPAHDAANRIKVDGEVWFRTGDAGLILADGGLTLLGRASAPLREGADALYPLQIEAAARALLAGRLDHVPPLAAVNAHGHVTLAVEDIAQVTALGRTLEGLGVERLALVRPIPLDRRHRSKVDYARVRAMVHGH